MFKNNLKKEKHIIWCVTVLISTINIYESYTHPLRVITIYAHN